MTHQFFSLWTEASPMPSPKAVGCPRNDHSTHAQQLSVLCVWSIFELSEGNIYISDACFFKPMSWMELL